MRGEEGRCGMRGGGEMWDKGRGGEMWDEGRRGDVG